MGALRAGPGGRLTMAARSLGAPVMIPAIAPDGARFAVEKMEAHRRGLLHDAISVFAFSGDRLLIQRRAAEKYHCGGQWANTCCTHPFMGESVEDCAKRRLREEMGAAMPLKRVGELEYRADVGGGLIEHERVVVFRADVDAETLRLSPDPTEVMAARWVALPELRRAMAADPERYTPWFRIYMARWPELGLDA